MSHCDRDRPASNLPSEVTNLRRNSMRRTSLISALIGCFAVLAVIAPVAAARHGGGTTRTIALHGSVSFPGATGQASSKTSAEERELEVEVQHVRVLAGKRVNVFVNGTKWASPRVSSLGAFDVQRSTQRGQRVPRITSSSTVRVRTLGGTLIASGRF
jgi:hypothetical protein